MTSQRKSFNDEIKAQRNANKRLWVEIRQSVRAAGTLDAQLSTISAYRAKEQAGGQSFGIFKTLDQIERFLRAGRQDW